MTRAMDLVHVQQKRKAMNTDFEFTIACPRSDSKRAMQCLEKAHLRVHAFEQEWSEFIPTSPVAKFNRLAVGVGIPISDELYGLLSLCRELEQSTAGLFSCGIKGIRPFLPMPQWMDWDQNQMTKLHPSAHLGFGAIGKGYALDRVRTCLEQEGFENYLLSGGGSSLVFSGEPQPGRAWKIAWEVDADQHIPITHSHHQPWAIGVSSEQEQRGHILGDPARAGSLRSVLVGHRSAAHADAWSTAIYASGDSALQADQAAQATLDQDGIATWNFTFQRLWGPIRSLAIALLLTLSIPAAFSQESEEVDLSAMGDQSLTAQLTPPDQEVHRESLWILLPAVSLAAVILHMARKKRERL